MACHLLWGFSGTGGRGPGAAQRGEEVRLVVQLALVELQRHQLLRLDEDAALDRLEEEGRDAARLRAREHER